MQQRTKLPKPTKVYVSLAIISPLYEQLAARAAAEGVSLRAVCNEALKKHLGQTQPEARP